MMDDEVSPFGELSQSKQNSKTESGRLTTSFSG
jgi:hypothetical protein